MSINFSTHRYQPAFQASYNKKTNFSEFIPKDKQLVLNIENVKKAMAEGLTKKEMSLLFGRTDTTINSFFAKHNNEIDYKEYKKSKRSSILGTFITPEELAQKFDIAVEHAKYMIENSFKANDKKARIIRLSEEIPLFKKGKSRYYISKVLSYSVTQVNKDIKYYLEHQNEFLAYKT